MQQHTESNRLIHATSPYLLQHANNPVDWYEWGDEALTKAKKENKPILVSIGYSSCHWCHVMERESFEDKDIASIMNENFICIKVDREERPDIDQIYMEAVQAMGINGGWPLNVFLMPDQKPFYGGTYFPPKNWSQLLIQIAKVYKEKQEEINSSAEELTRQLNASDIKKFSQPDTPTNLTEEGLTKMFESMQARFDKQWGGLEKAPKFVMPTQWQWLLRYYAKTKNPEALEMVNLTLKRMAMGGLYDQVGGGFSRYSVDGQWFAPHFEKMLYDNAQLLTLYSEVYSIQNDEFYKTVVAETVAWLEREMTHPEGGFYSALDADSEGEEGKYYVWTKTEFNEVIGSDYLWLAKYFSITDSGNWEHGNNILFIEKNIADFINEEQLTIDVFNTGLAAGKEKLKARRDTRIRPGLDDKILTSWNAMMITGLCDAYKSFSEKKYLNLALKNIQFLEENLMEGKVYRSFRGKRSSTEGFLEDYAFLIRAYISLYHVTFNELWLEKANHWTTYAQEHFYDHKEGYYHFTASEAQALIARKKEIFDNVIPSANGIMAANLFHLGIMLDNQAYQSQARKMVSSISHLIEGEPAYTSHWGMLYSEMLSPLAEVVVVGPEMKEVATQLNLHYLPFAVILGTETQSDIPLLQDKTNPPGFGVTIFVCFNKTCKLPVHSVEEALMQIP